MHPSKIVLLCAFANLAAFGDLAAQSLEEGYAAAVRPLPNDTSNPFVLDATRTVYFTGTRLVLDNGVSPRDLLTLPTQVFGSFTIAINASTLLFGENSQGGIWLVPSSGTPRLLTRLAFNYDAVAWTPGMALVSAKTGGLASPNTEIWAVDLATGATDLIVELAGASGPLVLDAAGNLIYATAGLVFPPPPGAGKILRFTQTKLLSALGPTKLGAGDAQQLFVGLDSAGDIALDADGDLFVIDWWNSRVLEIDDLGGGNPVVTTLMDYAAAANSPATLQMVPGRPSALAVFEPFQPEGGGSLLVHESAFVTGASALRAIAATRPGLVASHVNPIPPGPVSLEIRGGPANGVALLVFGMAGMPGERVVQLAGIEQPIFWSTALVFGQELGTFPLTLDATGKARAAFVNPGGAPFQLGVQAAVANLGSLVFGSTPFRVLELR